MKKLYGVFIVFYTCLSNISQIALTLVLGNNMVLQRIIEIPLWGTANSNTSVIVNMAKKIVITGLPAFLLPKRYEEGYY